MSKRPASSTARAHSNIALIKYWGKRDAALNLPAVGSISITLDALYTDTRVTFVPGMARDKVEIGGRGVDAARFTRFLDLIRARTGSAQSARVESWNNFPTGAGLASSASGFAALALAGSRAAGLELSPRDLSILARQGSGSAARSVFGGFAQMHRGSTDDGLDACAEPLLEASEWPLDVVVAITEREAKKVDSSAGMSDLDTRSDYFDAWVSHSEDDLAGMRDAIAARDFSTLGELTEYSCLKMHGLMLSTRPGLLYWNAATVAAMHAVRGLREDGVPVYFTIDAGPQVKALCQPADTARVATALQQVPGVLETRTSALGPAAHLLD
ncbi:diphosphomevalonate decarboxylase [Salinisphaera aquimarina]|uniref:diphosphomevalonate decarboxylase n=1 Tax=Salinisphaera aquimarina TaxID=2094031 RepID=A0ABV7ET18_9GAMM